MWTLQLCFATVLAVAVNVVAAGILRTPGDVSIIGGEEVDIEEYPYQVSVMIDGTHNCGGSIISKKHILTAAHCVSYPNVEIQQYKIRAGSSFRVKCGQLYDVESLIAHPKYDYYTIDYDIAVIQISGLLEIDQQLTKIVKLADGDTELNVGDLVTVTGWGMTETGVDSNVLKAGTLSVVDKEKCNEAFKEFKIPITDRMLCAGYFHSYQSACYGDSGGPLVNVDMVQYGVVSFGPPGCMQPGVPNVYANVVNLRSWIKETTGV